MPFLSNNCSLIVNIAAIFFLSLAKASELSSFYVSFLPIDPPPLISDPSHCATENLTKLFDVPKPTGTLDRALESFASGIWKTCDGSKTPGIDCFPDQSSYCDFSTAIPENIHADYSSYGDAVSAWWATHSSAAASLSKECPEGCKASELVVVEPYCHVCGVHRQNTTHFSFHWVTHITVSTISARGTGDFPESTSRSISSKAWGQSDELCKGARVASAGVVLAANLLL